MQNSNPTRLVANFDLIVLMIAQHALRSALAAQLTAMGENVMTVSRELTIEELDRLARQHAVLVADKGMLSDRLSHILADSGWRHVIVLNGVSAPAFTPRVLRLQSEDAMAKVKVALGDWRAMSTGQGRP